MALGIDGTPQGANGSGAALVLPGLTTSLTNTIVVVVAASNLAFASAPSGSTLGAFTLRKNNGSPTAIAVWTVSSAGALTNEVVTLGNGAAFTTGVVFAVSGANYASPYDGNAAIPQANTTGLLTATTDNANDMLIGGYRFANTATPTEGSGWTKIYGANYFMCEYLIVAATQSASSVPIGTGNTDQNGGVLDAIVQATSAATDIIPLSVNLNALGINSYGLRV